MSTDRIAALDLDEAPARPGFFALSRIAARRNAEERQALALAAQHRIFALSAAAPQDEIAAARARRPDGRRASRFLPAGSLNQFA